VATPAPSPLRPRGRLRRRDRLLRARDFALVLRRGKRRGDGQLTVSVLTRRSLGPAGDADTSATARDLDVAPWRLGLAVGRRAGHSPARARLRRLLREAFRALRAGWPPLDVVVSAARPWPEARLEAVGGALDGLVQAALSGRRRD
jgi:ribonuclease P protein component